MDCGEWQGLTPDEVRQRWPNEFDTYLHSPLNFQFPGGESLEAARLRAFQRVYGLAQKHAGETVMLVSHTALNRLILLSVLDKDSGGFWKLGQDTCAINVFEIDQGKTTLVSLNDTCHLSSISEG